MQFTANRLLLLKAVKTALKVVRPNRDIPEIAGVLIEADASSGLLTVTGTDVRTHIQRRLRQELVEESGSIILTPLIASVLDKLAGESVSFQSDNGTVLIRSGNASFSLPFLEAKAFPRLQIPFPEDTIRVQGLNDLFRKTVFAADGKTTESDKVSLQYVRLAFADGLTTAEATNSTYAAISTSPHCADGNLELFLHEKAVRILASIVAPSEELFVGISGKFAVFMKEDLFFSSMMFGGKFLGGSRILERLTPAYQATTDAGSLSNLTQNVSALFQGSDIPCVNLRIGADNITMQAETASGHSSSAIRASDSIPTPEDGFYFDQRFLLDCLRHIRHQLLHRQPAQLQKQQRRTGNRLFRCSRLAEYRRVCHQIFCERLPRHGGRPAGNPEIHRQAGQRAQDGGDHRGQCVLRRQQKRAAGARPGHRCGGRAGI